MFLWKDFYFLLHTFLFSLAEKTQIYDKMSWFYVLLIYCIFTETEITTSIGPLTLNLIVRSSVTLTCSVAGGAKTVNW